MKTAIAIAISLFLVMFSITEAQNSEVFISIKDDRNLALYEWDTTTAGKKQGGLYVSKIRWVSGVTSFHPDTITATSYQVYILVDKKLFRYEAIEEHEIETDQIAYIWVNDSTLTITLINSKVNARSKPRNLMLRPNGVLIIGDLVKN